LAGKIQDERGFALIELMVVIVIIAILAGIAVPSFLNQRGKGQDACAKTQLSTMRTTMETIFTDDDSYADITMARLHSEEPTIVVSGACGDNSVAVLGGIDGGSCNPDTGPTQRTYCISQSSATGRNFVLTKDSAGVYAKSCEPSGGGCQDGTW
jgi:type IV pilus assembly protein PilA